MPVQRVPAGTPTGGRFAPTSRSESTVSLLEESIDAEAVLAQAQASGRFFAKKFGVDADDITSETLLAFYTAAANRAGQPSLANPNGYLHSTAASMAVKAVSGAKRSEVRQALSVWESEVRSTEQRLGRRLGEEERHAIAEKVRMAQPARRRAPEGFERTPTIVSIDEDRQYARSSGGRHNLIDRMADSDANSSPAGFRPGSVGDRAEDALAEGGFEATMRARRMAWNALAEASGAPNVVEDSVTERHAKDFRRIIESAGGPMAVAERWEAGQASVEETRALFGAFGPLSDRERSQVVGVMRRSGAYAPDLWDSTIGAATVRRGVRRAG